MISSRFLFAGMTAAFCVVMGAIVLMKRPLTRQNAYFAFFSLAAAPPFFPAPTWFSEQFGHEAALIIYRLAQFGHPLCNYFLLCFMQEFAGVYEGRAATLLRRIAAVCLVVAFPFYLSTGVIQDFQFSYGTNDLTFVRYPGPLFAFHQGLFFLLLISGIVTTFKGLLASDGNKTHQRRYITLGVAFGVAGVLVTYLSYRTIDMPHVYFPLFMAMFFCFAYACFKHGLFEFDVWSRGIVIYTGVYAALISIPLFVFFPFRSYVPVNTPQFWAVMCIGTLMYGILFSFAPIATAYLKNKTEKELLATNQRLKDLNALKENLISNITHEFKSPLSNVENAVDILLRESTKKKPVKAKSAKYLMMIRNNAERLGQFIQSLLEVARIEQAGVQLKQTMVDFNGLIQDAIEIFRPMADEKKIKIIYKSDHEVRVRADEEKLSQVVYNLISNALKFTQKGAVSIDLKQVNDKLRLVVRDSGSGIDPAYLPSVFDKFFRAPNTMGTVKGTGLGLAIAKGWVEAHHGKIWVESDGIGKGSCFFVELPSS